MPKQRQDYKFEKVNKSQGLMTLGYPFTCSRDDIGWLEDQYLVMCD